nr:unnamed protein product [Callosobruchus analis]
MEEERNKLSERLTIDEMPGRSEKHKNWSLENMQHAVEAVRNKEMGYLKASQTFNIPKSTLEDYVKHGITPSPRGRKPTLPLQLEESLVDYCLEIDRRFFGLSTIDKRKRPWWKKNVKGFLKQHSNLALRLSQGLSKARIKGFTQENVFRFFDLLEPALEKIKFNPLRL